MTSTLQQEGGRKLRLSSSQVMRLAQNLYERGFITYMRTDNVALSDEALQATRAAVAAEYGQQYLSPQPKQYSSKSKNAQEAHEAIRPTTPYRAPQSVQGELNGQELALYRLVWQRTLASQMADATGTTVSVRIGATSTHESTDCEFAASGTTITFPGYRAVYVADDETATAPPRRCSRHSPAATSCPSSRSPRRATPPRHPPATPRPRWSSDSRNSGSAGPRRGHRSSRPSRTAATCGRRARRWCPPGQRSPSSDCSSSTSTTSSTTS